MMALVQCPRCFQTLMSFKLRLNQGDSSLSKFLSKLNLKFYFTKLFNLGMTTSVNARQNGTMATDPPPTEAKSLEPIPNSNMVYIFSDDDNNENHDGHADSSEPELLEIHHHLDISPLGDDDGEDQKSTTNRPHLCIESRKSLNKNGKCHISSAACQPDLSEISILPISGRDNRAKHCHHRQWDAHNQLDLTVERVVEDLTNSPPNWHKLPESLQCRICMDTLVEPAATECGHVFCMACLLAAIERQPLCPLCRQKFHIRKIRRLYI